MTTYTWKINSLTKKTINSVENVVFVIVWEKIGRSPEGYYGHFRQALNLKIDDVDTNNFIVFDELKEEDVIEWVKKNVDEAEINAYIETEIEKSKSHLTQVNDGHLPWQVYQPAPTEVIAGEEPTVIINEIPGMPDALPDDPVEAQKILDYGQEYMRQAGISS